MLKKIKQTLVMLKECVTMSLDNIWGNKVRSFLTVLGILIGVTAVIALITTVNGVSGSLTSSFSSMGAGTLTISVSGRVDTVTAPELEAGLKFGDATQVVLDLADVPYMSSAGLRLLLTAHKTMMAKGGELKIANIQPTVREVLDITGFSDILNLV